MQDLMTPKAFHLFSWEIKLIRKLIEKLILRKHNNGVKRMEIFFTMKHQQQRECLLMKPLLKWQKWL